MKSSIKVIFALAILALLTPFPALGGIILEAEYHLGEAGSIDTKANNLPLDSSGNARDFTNYAGSSGDVVDFPTTDLVAPGSTVCINTGITHGTGTTGREAWYGGDFSALATDDFAFGIYARAPASTNRYYGNVLSLGGNTGSFVLALEAGQWRASAHQTAYIGAATPFVADTWVHLAVIRSGGENKFYVDGVAQASAIAGGDFDAPVHDTIHLGLNPGGATSFDGMMDELRVVSFDAGTDAGDIIYALQNGVAEVPEPSTLVLLVAGILALCFWRRK